MALQFAWGWKCGVDTSCADTTPIVEIAKKAVTSVLGKVFSLLMLRPPLLSYRLMHGHQFGTVWECRFNLHIVDHFGDPLHDLAARDNMGTFRHQVSDAAPVACALDDKVGNQRDRFGMIELDASFQPAPRNDSSHCHKQFVFFARRQVHCVRPFKMPMTWAEIGSR